jgi:hypothetical protein
MVLLNVPGKAALDCSLENEVLQIADVAPIVRVKIVLGLLVTQLGERVYDDTEDNVQANDVDNDLEARIVTQFEQVLLHLVIVVHWLGDVTNAATIPQSLIQLRNKALKHGLTIILTNYVRIIGIDVIIVHTILKIKEGHYGVNVHKDHHEHDGHHDLHDVHRDGQHDVLQYDRPVDHIQQME